MAEILVCVLFVLVGAFVLVAALGLLVISEIIKPEEVREWLKRKKEKKKNNAVEVVRCKDCKHWDENYEICLPDNKRGCKCKMFTADEGAPFYTAPTGYCWCGKKEV